MDSLTRYSRHSVGKMRYRRGLTVLELLVVMSIIGLLASLLLPAIMHARESARRMLCTNHLRQLGIAIHSYHDRERRLPAAWEIAKEDSHFAYGWASQLLPEIEQSSMNAILNPHKRPSQLTSLSAAEEMVLPLLLCPSDIAEPSFELVDTDENGGSGPALSLAAGPTTSRALIYLPTTNYVGVYGTVEADDVDEYVGPEGIPYGDGSVINGRRVKFADLQRGLSNTMLVGERKMAAVPSSWLGIDLRGDDAECRLVGSAMTGPNCDACDECEFSSRHAGGSNFLWADGRVTIISKFIDPDLYQESAKRTTH
jgi:prepilin-type N-terminal cleavage/methylation domain-containing protein/prepilin-type processing-associated H-X9-DG protein